MKMCWEDRKFRGNFLRERMFPVDHPSLLPALRINTELLELVLRTVIVFRVSWLSTRSSQKVWKQKRKKKLVKGHLHHLWDTFLWYISVRPPSWSTFLRSRAASKKRKATPSHTTSFPLLTLPSIPFLYLLFFTIASFLNIFVRILCSSWLIQPTDCIPTVCAASPTNCRSRTTACAHLIFFFYFPPIHALFRSHVMVLWCWGELCFVWVVC